MSHTGRGEDIDPMKLAIESLSKYLKGRVWDDMLTERLESWDGVEGVMPVGFSSDRHHEMTRMDMGAFVMFETVEQRNAAREDEKVRCALLDSEFQLANKLVRCEARDPEQNVTLSGQEGEWIDWGRQEAVVAQATGQGQMSRWQYRFTCEVVQQAYRC